MNFQYAKLCIRNCFYYVLINISVVKSRSNRYYYPFIIIVASYYVIILLGYCCYTT